MLRCLFSSDLVRHAAVVPKDLERLQVAASRESRNGSWRAWGNRSSLDFGGLDQFHARGIPQFQREEDGIQDVRAPAAQRAGGEVEPAVPLR